MKSKKKSILKEKSKEYRLQSIFPIPDNQYGLGSGATAVGSTIMVLLVLIIAARQALLWHSKHCLL